MTDTAPAAPSTSAADYLAVRDLFVDDAYQRDLNLRWVLDRVRDYDRALLGALEVSDRGPDTEAGKRYAVIDGRHRLELASTADPDGEDAVLLCNVHQGLTGEQEAALFYQIDAGRRRLTGWDRWKARRAAGDQIVVDIERAAREHGVRIVASTANRAETKAAIASTIACERIVALEGLPLLAETIDVCVAAWATDQTFSRDALEAVALVLHHYPRDVVSLPRLIDACSAVTMVQLSARAKAMREHTAGANFQLAASILVQLLNSRRGSTGGKLIESFATVLKAEKDRALAEARGAVAARHAAEAETLRDDLMILVDRGLTLDEINRTEDLPSGVALRAIVPVLAERGLSESEIATKLDVSQRHVDRYRPRDLGGSGRPDMPADAAPHAASPVTQAIAYTPDTILDRLAAQKQAKPAPTSAAPVAAQPRTRDDGRKWGLCRACSTTITVRGDCRCTTAQASA